MRPRIDPGRGYQGRRSAQAPRGLRGILFDKDGTLFDFQATWGGWTAAFIAELCGPNREAARELAAALGFDSAAKRFAKSSPMIAGTLEVIVSAVRSVLPELQEDALRESIVASSAAAPQMPVTPLAPLLDRLLAAGLVLGVATNDAEAATHAHLAAQGVLDRFAFVAGYDSGFGAKPGHGMHTGFCRAVGLKPFEVAMIGDSLHDILSGRAAGMFTVAVLTGPAEASDLAPHADALIPQIGALPDWLAIGAPS